MDVVIPSVANGSALELLLNGEVISTFKRTATANTVQNIRPAVSASASASLSGLVPETFTIEWTDQSSSPQASIAAQGVSSGVSYVVQISKNGGETWQTIGYDQHLTMLETDPSFLEDVDQLQVRITSSDGFTCQTTTKTLDL